MKDKFRKYGGERIPNIIDYIKDYINKYPTVTISVGCDSSEKRRGIVYATTIVFYDYQTKNGAHVVFNRMTIPGKMDTFNRLYKEAEIIHDLAEMIEDGLKGFHTRKDLTDEQHRRYKLHLEQHKGNYIYVDGYEEERVMNSFLITNKDRMQQYKICDVHLDYNISFGDGKFKSHNVFKAAVPWFKSSGYRVWCKPYSSASTTAADMLLK
jgi:predicted RNase H-related nuclease YkuK (DUF458 family)